MASSNFMLELDYCKSATVKVRLEHIRLIRAINHMAGNAMPRQCQCLRKADQAATDDYYVCLVSHTRFMEQGGRGLKGGF